MNAEKTIRNEKTLNLVICAVMVAMATVLSMITVIKMPYGGSLTPVSMLPICLVSIMLGVKRGMYTSLVYSFIQLGIDLGPALSWGLSSRALFACIVFDYILAFSSLGLAGIFRKKGNIGICGGIALAMFIRFICHVISGGTVFSTWCEWDNAWIYSICYNGAFMLPEMILTMIAAIFLVKTPLFLQYIKR